MKTIAFIGVDGAGKTTLIREIKKQLTNSRKKCVLRYMGFGRDYSIPLLSFFMGNYHKFKHRSGKYGFKDKKKILNDNYRIRRLSWILIQYLEFWFRYLRNKLFVRADFLFYDRYFYDGLILANDFGFKIIKKITPRPNICFLIVASAELIRKRKKEATIVEINEFYQRAKRLSSHFEVIEVDNSGPLKEVAKEIVGKILNEFRNN